VTALRRSALCFLVALGASGENLDFDLMAPVVVQRRLAAVRETTAEREHALRDLFIEAGCSDDNLVEQKVKHSQTSNVICSMPGQTESTIIVGAHLDCVKVGKGVVDNWSGASLLPNLFQSLKKSPHRHNFFFIGFTDEERGLVGSKFYVDQLKKEKRKLIRAMVNLDSLGTGTTKMESERGDKRLMKALITVATANKFPLQVVNMMRPTARARARSDSDSFQDWRIPTVILHSLTDETYRILHSLRDRMDAIRFADYYDSYRLIAAYLVYLDYALDTEPVK